MGTPASMSAKEAEQHDAIEVDPLEDSTSVTILMVYGNLSTSGITESNAFSAKIPCPISLRPGPRMGFTSPGAYGGKL
mgnify:CR=1 FL=1